MSVFFSFLFQRLVINSATFNLEKKKKLKVVSDKCLMCYFSHGDFFTIVDLPEGEHEYKFFVDGQWVLNPGEVRFSSFRPADGVS